MMTAKAHWTYVCRLSDIVPNTGVAAKVGTAQVAIFRLTATDDSDTGLYALCNRDPRSGAYVLARGLVGNLKGRPVVASPIYKQHYDLNSGECIEDPALSILSYPVRTFDGMVLVKNEARSPAISDGAAA